MRKEFVVFGIIIVGLIVVFTVTKTKGKKDYLKADNVNISFDENNHYTSEPSNEYESVLQPIEPETQEEFYQEPVITEPIQEEEHTEEDTSYMDEPSDSIPDEEMNSIFSNFTDNEMITLLHGYASHNLDGDYIRFLSESCLSQYNSDANVFEKMQGKFFTYNLNREQQTLTLTTTNGNEEYVLIYTVSDEFLESVKLGE